MAAASSGPVIAPLPSTVNTSSSTALSTVLEAKNPIPTCMMWDGSGPFFIPFSP